MLIPYNNTDKKLMKFNDLNKQIKQRKCLHFLYYNY